MWDDFSGYIFPDTFQCTKRKRVGVMKFDDVHLCVEKNTLFDKFGTIEAFSSNVVRNLFLSVKSHRIN